MANTFLTSTIIAKEALRQLENNLTQSKLCYRDWENKFAKDGDTLGIRKPIKFKASKQRVRVNSDITESNVTLTVATQAHVSFQWETKIMTDTIERVSERYIKPAMSALANTVDVDMFSLYSALANQVGTPGTAPNGFDPYADAMRRLDEEAVPGDMRYAVMNPEAKAETLKGLDGILHEKIVGGVVTKGFIGSLANLDFHMAQNVKVHTTGVFTTNSTPLVNGANQSGDTLLTDGWASGAATLKKGDVFTIAGVYAVNPKTSQSTGTLRQFVVTADITSTLAVIDIPISPSIIYDATSAYQNVDAAAADDAAITMIGTESTQYPINMAFHKDCFTLAMRPLEIPTSVSWGARESYEGLSVRAIKAYDITNDLEVLRFDILYGVLAQYPELGCRIIG